MRATLYFAVPEDMIVPYAAETTEQATHSGMRIVFCETPRAEAIVGPVRKYSIGAVLLDKRDPSKVLARSCEPLVRPEPSEREGYVPNVVYTCGDAPERPENLQKNRFSRPTDKTHERNFTSTEIDSRQKWLAKLAVKAWPNAPMALSTTSPTSAIGIRL
jgi:hypothetical protein